MSVHPQVLLMRERETGLVVGNFVTNLGNDVVFWVVVSDGAESACGRIGGKTLQEGW